MFLSEKTIYIFSDQQKRNFPFFLFFFMLADISARTAGEIQTPIHYAAKYNAEDSLKVLLHMGGNISDKDYKNRTPLFVAAESGIILQ